MIGFLRGKIIDAADGKIMLGVGSDSGMVGYSIHIPQNPSYLGFSPGAVAELHIYTHVREDVLDLYGFSAKQEKELFLLLLSVTGIGPKVALGILSRSCAEDIVHSILGGDKDALTKIPGIGKKTAERVILELTEPMKKKVETGCFSAVSGNAVSPPVKSESKAALLDAKAALVGLGYRENDISGILNDLIKNASPAIRAEELIRTALQRLV